MDKTANTTILNNPLSSVTPSSPKNLKSFFKTNLGKIIIALLVVAVVGELIYGSYTLFSPSKSKQGLSPFTKVNNLENATISLVPDKNTYKKGETVSVDVKVFTGGYTTDSTDLVIKYDPLFLEPDKNKFAETGKIYSEYPAIEVNKEQGMIGISGITTPGEESFLGTGSFAKLNFTALKEGETVLQIDFQQNKTDESNVVLTNSTTDILGSVNNAKINISESPSSGNMKEESSCSGFVQSCKDATGKVGSQNCSAGIMKNGSCSYDPKYTVSCEVCKT